MFVQSVEFIRAHATGNANGGNARGDISIYGQESNYTMWRLARMNLAIRGIGGQIAHGDTFHNNCHPDVVKPVRRGPDPEEPGRGGARGLHGRAAGPALLLDPDSGLPVVPGTRSHAASLQVKYIESVLTREVTEAIHRDLKKMEFDIKPKGPFVIGMSLKLKPGIMVPIRHYREK